MLRLAMNLGLVLLTALPFPGLSRDLPASQTFPLTDTKGLTERTGNLEAVEYKGRKAVRLTKEPPGEGLALLPAIDFQHGTACVASGRGSTRPMSEVWTHIKIEVAGRSAKLYLNGSEKPSLVVDGLKGQDLRGAVGLWGYAGEEYYFSKLTITPSEDQPVKNDTDPSGVWEVTFAAETGPTTGGPLTGSLRLTRNGDKLTAVWSGALGDNQPVAGKWRDGYGELSFSGTWPDEMREGAARPRERTAGGLV
jgi:hypothetical protein